MSSGKQAVLQDDWTPSTPWLLHTAGLPHLANPRTTQALQSPVCKANTNISGPPISKAVAVALKTTQASPLHPPVCDDQHSPPLHQALDRPLHQLLTHYIQR